MLFPFRTMRLESVLTVFLFLFTTVDQDERPRQLPNVAPTDCSGGYVLLGFPHVSHVKPAEDFHSDYVLFLMSRLA